MGSAIAVAVTLGLNERQIADAMGIVGSMAGGIIEYLADGAWTKRLHAGWAAQSGIRAALSRAAASSGRARCLRERTASSSASPTAANSISRR